MTNAPTLSQRINNSTRPLHTHLNALILSLLPLALPPHTSDSRIYLRGIAHILPIYEAFEEEFRLLLARLEEEGTDGDGDGLQEDPKSNGREDKIQKSGRAEVLQALNQLYMSELERTCRLRQDIFAFSPIPDISVPPRLAGCTTHIHSTLSLHPHLLLAYTWVLYMALFSGGRYIRAQLRQADPVSSNRKFNDEKYEDVNDRLSFWTFKGDRDGEEFKAEFKKRFMEVERCLTEREKEQVLQEAVYIMGAVIGVVEEIAGLVGNTRSAQQAELATGLGASTKSNDWLDNDNIQSQERDEPSMQRLLLKHILPLGMVELISEAAEALMLAVGSCKAAEDGKV